MTRNLDVNLVRAFVAVAETGGMTKAGDDLGLTQGAVSQQIKRLEETLQVRLFDRRRRGLLLTRDGERLLGLSANFLAANDEIWEQMAAPAIRGEVKLGIPHDLVSTYLPIALGGFVAAHPSIQVSLVTEASPLLLDGVKGGHIDLAIVEEPMGPTEGDCLGIERLVWIGGRSGGAHRKRPLPLSMIGEECAFRGPVSLALGRVGIEWVSVFEQGTIEATMTVVKTGLAVSVSLASAVPDELKILGHSAGLPDLPSFAINLYVADDQKNLAAQELAHHIRKGAYTLSADTA